ncbi:peptidylprolyl isomerase [Enterococcus casseliflavus]|nr:peptidylprolyl isomerase [Enterococcus casseliflavus]
MNQKNLQTKEVKKMKKIVLLFASVLSLSLLTACTTTNSEVATIRGGKIRIDDFYQAAFLDPTLGSTLSSSRKQANEQLLQEIIIKKVFLETYGESISNARIEEMYAEQEEIYGGKEQFQQVLLTSGLTKARFQEMIKERLAIEAGLKSHMEIGETELDAVWEDFHPPVVAQLIQVSDELKAKELLKELQKENDRFEEVAKEHSEHVWTEEERGGKITFDSSTEEIPSEVKNAAFSLENDELSTVIPVINPSTNQTSYFIVKMIENKEKGNEQETYLEELKEIAKQKLLDDPEFVSSVIGKELDEADIVIRDERLKDLLSDLLTEDEVNKSDGETAE